MCLFNFANNLTVRYATQTQKININLDVSLSYIIVEMNGLFPPGEEFLLLMEYSKV